MKVGILTTIFAGLLLVSFPLASTAGPLPDTDGDTIPDVNDNCVLIPNAGPQNCDSDGDGYGNVCDCDFDQNNLCNAADFTNAADPTAPQFLSAFQSGTSLTGVEDMDCSGAVNAADFTNPGATWGTGLFLNGFNAGVPGPGLP